jgi:hypothetical protein
MPLWSLVVMSGFIGAAVLAPLYWLIGEGLMQHVAHSGDRDRLNRDRDRGSPLGWVARFSV